MKKPIASVALLLLLAPFCRAEVPPAPDQIKQLYTEGKYNALAFS